MRRISIILATLATVAVLPISPAHAVPPLHEPIASEPITITDHCDFDVFVDPVVDRGRVTTFFDQEGNIVRQHISGALIVEVTNLETEETVRLNVSGPGTFIPQEDGSLLIIGTGSWLLAFIDNRPGELLLTHGHFEAVVTPDGEFLLTEPPGSATDVCALLS